MPNFEHACLDRAWPVICQIVALLTIGLQTIAPGGQDVWRLYHLARLSESLLRRWLLVRALLEGALETAPNTLNPPLTPAKAGVYGQETAPLSMDHSGPWIPAFAGINGKVSSARHRNPVFRLVEPERVYPPTDPSSFIGPGPRLTWLDEDRAPISEAPGPLAPSLTRLKHRCAALQAVLDQPEHHVQRMTRWFIRALKTCQRIFPLRVGDPPGASHQQRRKDPERQIILSALNELCWDLRYRRQPP